MNANNPLVLVIVVLLIVTAIYLIQSNKANSILPDLGGNIAEQNKEKAKVYQAAPEIIGIKGYINAKEGFKLADVKGNVILVDFWTYSCINCIRTLPYLVSWDETYRDKGLVIVGIHTPEFEFEKDIENVKKAVETHEIEYRVVLDNDYSTWRAYQNQYWPRKYLIDADGYIRYNHIGEGGYEETEQMIKKLLMERDEKTKLNGLASENVLAQKPGQVGTPELYFGYEFAEPRQQFLNKKRFERGNEVDYELPQEIEPNIVYLEGKWKNNQENIELSSEEGTIVLGYQAKVVNIVAGKMAELEILVDGKIINETEKGSDIDYTNGKGIVKVTDQKLYNIVNDAQANSKTVTIKVKGKGFQIYTFTFG